MPAVARFEMVTQAQFIKDGPAGGSSAGGSSDAYDHIQLPQRATQGAAGYDFVCPMPVHLAPGQSMVIPTGIRAHIQPGWALLLFPRSSLGFNFRMQLDNTVGVIDSDYYFAPNQGHILVKITNASFEEKTLILHPGDRFCQGIFLPYGTVFDEEEPPQRTGGLGSTGR